MKNHAVGVNPVDTYVRSGTAGRRPQLPVTPGADAAGEVYQVGEGVSRLRVRDCLQDLFSGSQRLGLTFPLGV